MSIDVLSCVRVELRFSLGGLETWNDASFCFLVQEFLYCELNDQNLKYMSGCDALGHLPKLRVLIE